jgi:hypothetical protein
MLPQRGRAADPIGETGAASIEQDQTRARGEPLLEGGCEGMLPHQLEVREGARNEDEVERAVAHRW